MAVSGAKVTSLSPDTYLSTLVIYDGVRLTLINFCSVWCCVCALLAVAWCLSVFLAVEQLDISSLVLSRRLHLTYPALCFKEIQASSKIRVLHFQALHFKKCLPGSSIIAVCCQLSSTKLYTQFDGLDHHNAFVAMQFVSVSLHLRVQHDLWKAERCAGPSAIADACELLVFFCLLTFSLHSANLKIVVFISLVKQRYIKVTSFQFSFLSQLPFSLDFFDSHQLRLLWQKLWIEQTITHIWFL